MTIGNWLGAIVLAVIVAFVIVETSKPKPPKPSAPFCLDKANLLLSDYCRNLDRFGKA
jgi:hypothetical protein